MIDRRPLYGFGLAVLAFLPGFSPRSASGQAPAGGAIAERRPDRLPDGVPDKVAHVLKAIDEEGEAPPGFEGGGAFHNEGRRGGQVLPRADAGGKAITYHAWDVNRREPNRGRGAERLVTGSDGSAYYTADDFQTFIAIRKSGATHAAPVPTARPAPRAPPEGDRLPAEAAAKVNRLLDHLRDHDAPMPGYEGGRTFSNFEQVLPRVDDSRRVIRYREWDVNPKVAGRNRGAERLITGSDGRAYYTEDHYRTFRRVR